MKTSIAMIKELLINRESRVAIFTLLALVTVLTTYGICSSYTAYAIYSSNQVDHNNNPFVEMNIPANKINSIVISNKDPEYGSRCNNIESDVANNNKAIPMHESKKTE